MAPQKKKHETQADKQRAFRERQEKAGKRRRCVWISEEAADRLKELAEQQGGTQGEVVEALIMKKRPRK